MLTGPLPDLAGALRLQHDAAELRAGLDRAGRELSTGRREDVVAAAGGDPARLYAIERGQARATREAEAVTLARGRIGATQIAMGALEGLADELGADLQAALARNDMPAARLQAQGAPDAFRSAVATLNTRFGGRALFAGAATDGPALAPAQDILDDVQGLVNGAASAADAIAQVEAYFEAPGGGFETAAYLGAATDAPDATLADGQTIGISRRADAPEARTLLRGLALAAVATDAGYAGPAGAVPGLLEEAAAATLEARGEITEARAGLGLSEQRLETAEARIAARREALDLAWNEATARDPYQAATEFQALEQQLERLFTVTARLSGLTLTDFLR